MVDWSEARRVRATREVGDGRRPIAEGSLGTVRRVIGGGAHHWLVTVSWDDAPKWEWPYLTDEIEAVG